MLNYEESDFKKQIASALKWTVNFYIEQYCFFKDSFLMASTFLDPRVRKFRDEECQKFHK